MVKRTSSRAQATELWRKRMSELTIADLKRYFDFHNRTEGKSEKTISWYNEVLGRFERFLMKSGISVHIGEIGEPEVRGFIAYLQTKIKWIDETVDGDNPTTNEGLSPEGIQNRVRALKAFFAWLHREGYADTHRLEHLPNFKTHRKIIEILTEDEIARLLRSMNPRTVNGARDYAIVMLMLDSGLRMSEVIGVRAADVDIETSHLKVIGKGGKERMVPFGTTTQKALWLYAHHYRPEPAAGDPFFLTDGGRSMTVAGFRSMFSRVGDRSGVTRLHPHLCRHTFATRYLMNGGDIFSLQQILGHTTLEMVRRYVSLASAHVAVQHRKFSPMDRMALPTSKSGSGRSTDSRSFARTST